MSILKLPLIIAEGLDVQFYNRISDAELKIEPIDAKQNVYRGYDAQGRLLKIETDGFKVKIDLWEEEATHIVELTNLLIEFLNEAGELEKNKEGDYDLCVLIEKCKKFIYVPPKGLWDVIKKMFNSKG